MPRPGESADEWLGRCVHIEEDSVTPLAADDAPIARLLRGDNVNGLEHAVICADGELRHRRAWGETILAADGSVSGAVLAFHDVTQQRQAEEALRHHALHDSLTGLPNRTHLLDGLRTSISRARRTGRLIAVCMLDLDHIKLVNDTLGHLAGDLLLIAVAQRLSDAVRPGDTVARIGSDEFAVVCDEVEDEGEALQLAEDLRAILAHPIHLHGREVRVTVSAGVALARDGQPTADALLRNADTALSAAKSGGRDRSAMFDTSLHERAMQRLETERALVRALAGKAIEARFQPIVSSTNGSIVGVEALARLRDPERGADPAGGLHRRRRGPRPRRRDRLRHAGCRLRARRAPERCARLPVGRLQRVVAARRGSRSRREGARGVRARASSRAGSASRSPSAR